MKRITYLIIGVLLTSCSNPVEDYIKNDFSSVVRRDNVKSEIQLEYSRISTALADITNRENKDVLIYDSLKNRCIFIERDIKARYKALERGTIYEYVAKHGFKDMLEYENEFYSTERKMNKLGKAVIPYSKYYKSQMDKLYSFMLASIDDITEYDSFSKHEEITDQYLYEQIIGSLYDRAIITDDEMKVLVRNILENYFANNPTPKVTSYNFIKEHEVWYIKISNSKNYHLKAIKNLDGEYDYEYEEVQNSL